MIGTKSSGIGAGLIAAMAAVGAWAMLRVGAGAHVPIHFDLSGTPNNYAPAWFGLFILPAIGALLWLLPAILPRIDPRGENVQRSGRALGTILLTATIVIGLAQAMIVCATLGIRIDTTHLVGVMVGGMFIAIGNVFGKLRWNYTVGIRTPWTLADERVWDQTHRFGGWVFVLGGALMAVLSLLLPRTANTPVMIGLIVLMVALPIVKSYTLWSRMRHQAGQG
jgi:uncharacterized membrane protein